MVGAKTGVVGVGHVSCRTKIIYFLWKMMCHMLSTHFVICMFIKINYEFDYVIDL